MLSQFKACLCLNACTCRGTKWNLQEALMQDFPLDFKQILHYYLHKYKTCSETNCSGQETPQTWPLWM